MLPLVLSAPAARRVLVVAALVAATTVHVASARAEKRWYGFGGGAGLSLSPSGNPGGFAIASAAMDGGEQEASAILALRGTLAAYLAEDTWALLPLLTGDGGLRLGPVELFLTGGVQIFGGARRDRWTVFATFGLAGGAGAALRLGDELRLSLRTLVIWLPSQTAGKIEAPEGSAKPTFLFGGLVIALEFLRPFRGD